MPFTEDLSVFTDPAQFGTTAQYTAVGGTPAGVDVNGIFDQAAAQAGSEVLVQGTAPVFQCALADVPGCTRGATLVVGSTTYRVASDPRPDETGAWVALVLEAA